MTIITIVVTVYLFYTGYSYYQTPIIDRYDHPRHNWFKPSGVYGHGLGILGTFMVIFGVGIYIARKRYNFMVRYLRLKYLLEFHIFLCILGPILILFHTAFKFGGIVSLAFWSMVIVVLSGVIGRFIYIQIPRTIEGRALSLSELKSMKTSFISSLSTQFGLDENTIQSLVQLADKSDDKVEKLSITAKYFDDRKTIRSFRKILKTNSVSKDKRSEILLLMKSEISISNKIARLELMQRLFKYWHVAHLPFALIMLIILIIHVGVTLAFGYKWIF